MFGKLMNRYFYGKSGQGDFEKEDLPQNRWQLFWEMLRVRFSALLRLNLMYVVVWIPAIFFIGRFLMYGYSGLVNLSDFQAQLEAGSSPPRPIRKISPCSRKECGRCCFPRWCS